MRFTKMQGLGNDFVVVEDAAVSPADVRIWCDRRRGIGADGVLAVDESVTMRYWNADGSVAEMCGNGLRCVARYAVDRGWAEGGEWFPISTAVGDRRALVEVNVVTVEIGPVAIGGEVEVADHSFRRAWVGNPHAVAFVDDPDTVDVGALGARVATDPAFPEGANVEFVSVGEGSIRLRVWERGVGETLACGSGMVVAAAVAVGTSAPVEVEVRGGRGRVSFESGSAFLTGPAIKVFTGNWPD